MTNLENIAKLLLSRDEDNRELGRLLIDSQNIDEADLVQPMSKLLLLALKQTYIDTIPLLDDYADNKEIFIRSKEAELSLDIWKRETRILVVEYGLYGMENLLCDIDNVFDSDLNFVKPKQIYRGISLFLSKSIYITYD